MVRDTNAEAADAFWVDARVWTELIHAFARVAKGMGDWWLDSGKLSVAEVCHGDDIRLQIRYIILSDEVVENGENRRRNKKVPRVV